MRVEVFMPKYGLTMQQGTIGVWFKKEGEQVDQGEIIAEAMSEKITNNIESPAAGVIEKILVDEGETADVGAVIAYISLDKTNGVTEEKAEQRTKDYSTEEKVLKEIPLIGVRKAIAEKMTESLKKSPQATVTTKMNMAKILELKQSFSAKGESISLTALIVKLVAAALKNNPIINSALEKDTIKCYESINIGVAVAAEDKLYVPVIKNVQKKSIPEISQEITTLSQKARKDELSLEEMSGGTFTLSNMGMFDVDVMTPIINPPQAAILSIGKINKEVTVDEKDNFLIKPLATFSLTIDHAVLDGLPAARFLENIKKIFANPQDHLS